MRAIPCRKGIFFKTGSRLILVDDPCKDKDVVSRNRRETGLRKERLVLEQRDKLITLSEKDNLLVAYSIVSSCR